MTRWQSTLTTVALLGLFSPLVLGAQAIAAKLEIVRDGKVTLVISSTELGRMPHESVQGTDHGKTITFMAVPLLSVLRQAGVPIDSVKGPLVSQIIVATGADGYRATFSLAELAPGLGTTVVYIADQHDGAPLSVADGPLRLIVPSDKRPARWVRQVVRIAVRKLDP